MINGQMNSDSKSNSPHPTIPHTLTLFGVGGGGGVGGGMGFIKMKSYINSGIPHKSMKYVVHFNICVLMIMNLSFFAHLKFHVS